mmetsp:Transcript_31402/g.69628  ORF Transcript_31402/g.69628 Transcript_31402/m.69628 type:complete len:514 (+) Transcript_31402:298-1839(+)
MVKHRGHELRVPGDRFYDPTNAWGPKLNPKKKNGPRRKVKPYYLLKSEKAMKDRIDGSEDEKEKRKQNDAEAARIRKFRAKKKAAEASGDATPGTPGSKRQQEEITAGQIRVLEKKLRLATEFKGRKRLEREEKEKKLEESDKQVKAAEDALQQAKLSKMLAMEENAEIRDEVAASSRKEKEYGLEISLLEEERRKLKDLFYAVRNAEGDEYQRVASLSVSPQSPPASRRHRVPVIAAASDRRDDEQLHHPSPNHCSPFQHQHFASPGVGYEDFDNNDYENNLDDESSEDGSLSNNGVSLGGSAIGASSGSNASDDSEQAQESSPGKGQASKVDRRKGGEAGSRDGPGTASKPKRVSCVFCHKEFMKGRLHRHWGAWGIEENTSIDKQVVMNHIRAFHTSHGFTPYKDIPKEIQEAIRAVVIMVDKALCGNDKKLQEYAKRANVLRVVDSKDNYLVAFVRRQVGGEAWEKLRPSLKECYRNFDHEHVERGVHVLEALQVPKNLFDVQNALPSS